MDPDRTRTGERLCILSEENLDTELTLSGVFKPAGFVSSLLGLFFFQETPVRMPLRGPRQAPYHPISSDSYRPSHRGSPGRRRSGIHNLTGLIHSNRFLTSDLSRREGSFIRAEQTHESARPPAQPAGPLWSFSSSFPATISQSAHLLEAPDCFFCFFSLQLPWRQQQTALFPAVKSVGRLGWGFTRREQVDNFQRAIIRSDRRHPLCI